MRVADRERLARSPAHELALDCVEAGVEAALPGRVVREQVTLDGDTLYVGGATYDLAAYDEVVVLGGGKAADRVAAALEGVIGDRLDGGLVVTNDPVETDRVEVLAGSHPVPDEAGVAATGRVLDRARAAGDRTLVLAAVTGGGSALLAAPADGVSLADLRATTRELLDAGADVHEVNAVRRHLSAVKGGALARAARPATVVSLVVSDVVGDDLHAVASGPTVPDPTTYADALDVLERHDPAVPDAVRGRLERGAAGDLPGTPGPGDPAFDRASAHVVADGFTALAAAREVAADRGYAPVLLSSRVRGEAREAAKTHVAVAEECLATGNPVEPPAVLLSGGECTVTVRGDGRGGPNLEFALAAGIELAGGGDVVLASVDTDGRDGSTGAAGALVDADTVAEPRVARRALARNDACPYLDGRGALLRTGPTGTNVNDLRAVVVGRA